MQDTILFLQEYRVLTVDSLDVRTKTLFPRLALKKKIGGKRQAITELSRQSRTRLLRMARNVPNINTLITLTYPHEKYAATATGGNFMTDGRAVKNHMKQVQKWLVNAGCSGYWILEFQKRGAPHFHIFVQQEMSQRQRERITKLWLKYIGTDSKKSQKWGVRIDTYTGVNQASAAAYAAKYTAKEEQKQVPEGYKNIGRLWGWFGPRPEYAEEQILTAQEIKRVARVVNKYKKSHQKAQGYRARKRVNGITGHTFYNASAIVRQYLASAHGIRMPVEGRIRLLTEAAQSELQYKKLAKQ